MFNHEYDDRPKDDMKSCCQLIKTITKFVYHNPVPDITVEPAWVYTQCPSKTKCGFTKFKTSTVHVLNAGSDKQVRNGKIISEAGSMESKSVNNSNIFLFGLSFNLILTLGSLGFTSYSLHRLESRVAAVEQDLLVLNHPYRLDNHGISKLTSTHSPPISDSEMNGKLSKRAVDGSSLCRKCNSVCLNSKEPRKVRRF